MNYPNEAQCAAMVIDREAARLDEWRYKEAQSLSDRTDFNVLFHYRRLVTENAKPDPFSTFPDSVRLAHYEIVALFENAPGEVFYDRLPFILGAVYENGAMCGEAPAYEVCSGPGSPDLDARDLSPLDSIAVQLREAANMCEEINARETVHEDAEEFQHSGTRLGEKPNPTHSIRRHLHNINARTRSEVVADIADRRG